MQNSVVVLIDCWEPTSSKQKTLIDNIVNRVNSMTDLRSIIIADANRLGCQRARALSLLRNDKIQQHNLTLDKFEELIRQYKTIDKIYIFGMHWKECVHTNPLGVDNLSQLVKRYNIQLLTSADCVLAEEVYPYHRINRIEFFPDLSEFAKLDDTTHILTQ